MAFLNFDMQLPISYTITLGTQVQLQHATILGLLQRVKKSMAYKEYHLCPRPIQ